MKWPRFVHRIYADLMGCFWLPCPLCGEMFGGHEWLPGNTLMLSQSAGQGVCPDCGDLAREKNAWRVFAAKVWACRPRLWQHEETGRTVASESQPSKRWFEIPTMYEDELPEDIPEEIYSWWYDNSFVDGVRIGPKI